MEKIQQVLLPMSGLGCIRMSEGSAFPPALGLLAIFPWQKKTGPSRAVALFIHGLAGSREGNAYLDKHRAGTRACGSISPSSGQRHPRVEACPYLKQEQAHQNLEERKTTGSTVLIP